MNIFKVHFTNCVFSKFDKTKLFQEQQILREMNFKLIFGQLFNNPQEGSDEKCSFENSSVDNSVSWVYLKEALTVKQLKKGVLMREQLIHKEWLHKELHNWSYYLSVLFGY